MGLAALGDHAGLRILVTIPHAFAQRPGGARHGSEGGDPAVRSAGLLRCVSALHHGFAPGARLTGPHDPPANTDRAALTVVVCTARDQHLAHTLPAGLAHHHQTALDPRLLGFECHALLRANLGQYDWFCYMEDDLELTDGLFFDKLAWFNASFGSPALLQPNRFEVSTGPVPKLYIDGEVADQCATQPYQDITVRPRLVAPALGRSVEFRRVANPHSGCFFLDAAQMALLAAHPEFGRYNDAFYGPLESAASLAVMRCFDVYKPARENAAFLEVRHLDQRLLDRRVCYAMAGDRVLKTVHPEL